MVKRLLLLVGTLGASEIVRWAIDSRERAICAYAEQEGKGGSIRLALLAGSAGVAEAARRKGGTHTWSRD